jgi:hypothetical protein
MSAQSQMFYQDIGWSIDCHQLGVGSISKNQDYVKHNKCRHTHTLRGRIEQEKSVYGNFATEQFASTD